MKKFSSKARDGADADREFKFDLDDTEFGCVLRSDGDAVLEWSELAGTASDDAADMDSPEGAAFVARFFKLMMPIAEYTRFRRHMKLHKTSTDVLVEIMQAIQAEMEAHVEDAAARPTQPSSSSPGGRTAVKDERTLQLLSVPDGDLTFVEPAAQTG